MHGQARRGRFLGASAGNWASRRAGALGAFFVTLAPMSCGSTEGDLFGGAGAGAGAQSSGGDGQGGRGGAATRPPERGVAGEGDAGSAGDDAGESGAGGTTSGGATSAGGAGGADPSGDAGGSSGGDGGLSPMTGGGCRIALGCAQDIVDAEKRPCTMVVTDAEGTVQYSGAAGVELRGRSSLKYPKKNYSVELRTSGEEENPTNLFGMGQESDWVLDGSWIDRSFMRNDLVFALFRASGHYAPEARYCTLEVNEEERGIYRLVERIKRDDDRLHLPEDDGTGRTFLIKQDAGGALRLDIGLDADWELVYPNEERSTEAQRAGVQAWLDVLGDAVNGALAGGDAERIFESLSLESTVDWVLVEELSKNIDAYNLSLHLHREAGGLASFTPWDLDLAFGQPTLNERPEAKNEAPEGWIENRSELIRALSRSSELVAALGPRWRALRKGPYADANVVRVLDGFATSLDPADIARNFELWPIADVDFVQLYAPYSLYRIASHAEEVEKLRGWILARLRWMDANIDDYYVGP